MWKPKINPITRKRLVRFSAIKRAYWSFWMLVGLYLCSLAADLLSNDRPLFVRFEEESYFPIFKYYPDDIFTGSGLQTRPDYKAIARSSDFSAADGNFMVFPVIPYGAYETLEASEVQTDQKVVVVLIPQQRVASINVELGWRISRSLGLSPFFEEAEPSFRSRQLSELLGVSKSLEEAVGLRFANEREIDAFEEAVELSNGIVASVSLSLYRPRGRPPSSIRLTLREQIDSDTATRLIFRGDALTEAGTVWNALSEESRSEITESVFQLGSQVVAPLAVKIKGVSFTARFEKEEVHFPFRPSMEHWFGLDSSGRDVLARTLYGLRISLNFGIALVLATMLLGTLLGGLQGYRGGKTDLVGQRFTEIWEALPFLYIMILMGSVFGRSFSLLLLIYGAFNWIGISYYMRGEFLKLRKQPFVEAARCLGLSDWKIMTKHILPNALVPVITFFPFSLVGAIFSLSALDFLGFGMPPPTPSWGELLSQAQEFKYAWWLVLYPSLSLFVVILLGVFIGEGIRSAFDPRVNSHYES
ncbi:MAG: ABC transporter permease subunit [Opitutaceae bacterium]|nr:ABC transporter permease subunit [Opitutaceae bacterium]